MRSVAFIVLHTAASYDSRSKRVVHLSAQDVDRYHREVNGWRKIGYHWYVSEDGHGEQGRLDEEVGAHVGGFNGYTLGLCVSGHGDFERWNDKQLAEVVRKCAAWCREYRLGPEHVIGHHEAGEHGAPSVRKTCPGTLIDLDVIRELVRERLETSG